MQASFDLLSSFHTCVSVFELDPDTINHHSGVSSIGDFVRNPAICQGLTTLTCKDTTFVRHGEAANEWCLVPDCVAYLSILLYPVLGSLEHPVKSKGRSLSGGMSTYTLSPRCSDSSQSGAATCIFEWRKSGTAACSQSTSPIWSRRCRLLTY